MEASLFNEIQLPTLPRNRVKFFKEFSKNFEEIDTEYLECVGKILPRAAHHAEYEVLG
jgi:hypothetical protein